MLKFTNVYFPYSKTTSWQPLVPTAHHATEAFKAVTLLDILIYIHAKLEH